MVKLTPAQARAKKQIDENINAATRLLADCKEIAEKAKVGFSVDIEALGSNQYVPNAAKVMLGNVECGTEDEEISDRAWAGWQQSYC